MTKNEEVERLNQQYFSELYKALDYSQTQFDKSVIYFAGGSLGISFSFIEKIVKLNEAISKQLLIASWGISAIVIFIAMILHYKSTQNISWAILNYDSNDLEGFEKNRIKRTKWIKRGNILCIVFLFISLILIVIFVGLNI